MTLRNSPDWDALPSPRRCYYNPKLDPYVIAYKMTPEMAAAAEDGRYDDGSERLGGPLHEPDPGHPYNLISSLCEDGHHRPALDLDGFDHDANTWDIEWALANAIPEMGGDPDPRLVLVRSTSHWHAYLPGHSYNWAAYVELLARLVNAGLLDERYVIASINREQTLLRPPHIRKLGNIERVLL